jgi:hypothetical protein
MPLFHTKLEFCCIRGEVFVFMGSGYMDFSLQVACLFDKGRRHSRTSMQGTWLLKVSCGISTSKELKNK